MNQHSIPVILALLVFAIGSTSCTEALFPKQATERLRHFAAEAPQVGEMAPGIALQTIDGAPVELPGLAGARPTVLLLGSHSCPVFRYRQSWLRALERDFSDRVRFLVIYTIEAHPVAAPSPYTGAEWDLMINRLAGVRNGQAASFNERRADAERARADMGFRSPLLVDDMDNAVWRAFGRAPAPAFLIGRSGRILLRQVWFDPDSLRDALASVLTREDEKGLPSGSPADPATSLRP